MKLKKLLFIGTVILLTIGSMMISQPVFAEDYQDDTAVYDAGTINQMNTYDEMNTDDQMDVNEDDNRFNYDDQNDQMMEDDQYMDDEMTPDDEQPYRYDDEEPQEGGE